VIEAVLFDLGGTLIEWTWDDALYVEGHRAGLEAIGRSELPTTEALTQRFRERSEPLLASYRDTLEEIEYQGLVREVFAELGVHLHDAELGRFLEAEHAAWHPASQLGTTTHALLESLRRRGLKLAVVSNTADPPELLHRDLDRVGIAERVDFAVFSSEVGFHKPHPAIFRRALQALGVAPARALFVGDSLYSDVKGAKDLGIATVQALWFNADEDPDGGDPDFQAFTQMDVLNIVRRLNGGD
jgi:putative hydrolase of the HAD superfamily